MDDGIEPQYEDEDEEAFANGNSQKYSEDDFPTSDGDISMSEKKPGVAGASGEEPEDDSQLEAIKARVREMEEEAEKLKQLQSEVDRQMNITSPNQTPLVTSATGTAPTTPLSLEEKVEVDARSVYVGNVDYGATAEEVEQHFHGCGSINRVTILCNKFDGHPKGFAYIEFTDRESVNTAMAMDESLFRGRLIKVMPKRTNRPGMAERRGRGRGAPRGYRGRGSFFRGHSRFPRRGFRGRSAFFSPY